MPEEGQEGLTLLRRAAAKGLLAAALGLLWPAGAVLAAGRPDRAESGTPAQSGSPAQSGTPAEPAGKPGNSRIRPADRPESESPVVVASPKYADFVSDARRAGTVRRAGSGSASSEPAR